MRTLLIFIMAVCLSLSFVACSKYKLVDLEKEKAKETEEKMRLLEEKTKELEAKAKELEEKAKEEEKKEEEKKPDKIIIVQDGSKEKKGKEEARASKQSGWVKLYDDKGFSDRVLTIRFGRDLGNLHYVSSDDGKSGFNDKASAARYSVPDGWQAVLYENNNYSKRGYALTGNGSIADLGYFSDKCSSIRWEKK